MIVFGDLWHQKNVKALHSVPSVLSNTSHKAFVLTPIIFFLSFFLFCVSYQWFNQHFLCFQSCPFYVQFMYVIKHVTGVVFVLNWFLCLQWAAGFNQIRHFHLDSDKEHTSVKTLSLTDHRWPFILPSFHNSFYVVIDAVHAELLSKYSSFFQARLNFILNVSAFLKRSVDSFLDVLYT